MIFFCYVGYAELSVTYFCGHPIFQCRHANGVAVLGALTDFGRLCASRKSVGLVKMETGELSFVALLGCFCSVRIGDISLQEHHNLVLCVPFRL